MQSNHAYERMNYEHIANGKIMDQVSFLFTAWVMMMYK